MKIDDDASEIFSTGFSRWTLVLLFKRASFTAICRAASASDDGTKKRREERDVVDDGVEEDVEKA